MFGSGPPDVAYTTHVMLVNGVRESLGLSDLQCATCVIAAAAHDFRHPGIGANYLIAIGDDLALTYNDKSPLESFHTSEFFRMLKSKGVRATRMIEPRSALIAL